MELLTRLRSGATREELARFCRRHHIRRLSLFGSVLREDFTPRSDLDVLVELEPGHAHFIGHMEGRIKQSERERDMSREDLHSATAMIAALHRNRPELRGTIWEGIIP